MLKLVDYCDSWKDAFQNEKKILLLALRGQKVLEVEPYHFTFTPSECSDLLYYAERLVDTSLPFTGKKECGFSGEMDETTKLLMAQ